MAQKRATWPLRILVRTLEVRTAVSWCGSMMGSGIVAEPRFWHTEAEGFLSLHRAKGCAKHEKSEECLQRSPLDAYSYV